MITPPELTLRRVEFQTMLAQLGTQLADVVGLAGQEFVESPAWRARLSAKRTDFVRLFGQRSGVVMRVGPSVIDSWKQTVYVGDQTMLIAESAAVGGVRANSATVNIAQAPAWKRSPPSRGLSRSSPPCVAGSGVQRRVGFRRRPPAVSRAAAASRPALCRSPCSRADRPRPAWF